MKNKHSDSFNNDRINALRKRIDELLYLKRTWEEQKIKKDYEYIKIKVRKADYPHISEAFATAVAFHANKTTKRDKEPLKKAEALAEIAGRVNAAEMEFVYEESTKTDD